MHGYTAELHQADGKLLFEDFEMTVAGCIIPGIDMERYFDETNAFIELLTSGPITARITSGDELVLRGARRREVRFRRLP